MALNLTFDGLINALVGTGVGSIHFTGTSDLFGPVDFTISGVQNLLSYPTPNSAALNGTVTSGTGGGGVPPFNNRLAGIAPGFPQEEFGDEWLSLPGPIGRTGGTGATGATGATGTSGFGVPGIDAELEDAMPGIQGPQAIVHRFNFDIADGSQSTKFDATQKRVLGQRYFDPSNLQWGLTPNSTAILYVMLQTSNNTNAAGSDLYRETGTGSPVTVATLPTTTSLTATLISVDVSTAFRSNSNAGIFDLRIWITTNNGNDQATCTSGWIEITP